MSLATVPLLRIPAVTIFVRHTDECPSKGDDLYKRCRCPKSLRWYHNGRLFRQSAKTRTWSIAEGAKRDVEAKLLAAITPDKIVLQKTEARDMRRTVDLFLSNLKHQGAGAETLSKNTRELNRFVEFMAQRSKFYPSEIDIELLIDYRHTWDAIYPASVTRSLVQMRLNTLLKFCVRTGDLRFIPALSRIKLHRVPTLPLKDVQYASLLKAVGEMKITDSIPAATRLAVIKLMRGAGPAVTDAIMLRRDSLKWLPKRGMYHLSYTRIKTKSAVVLPLPKALGDELIEAGKLADSPIYLFQKQGMEGVSSGSKRRWVDFFAKAFAKAGQPGGHSHQLRDTFAVDLLVKGVPLEEVSKALGHTSIKTTEKYYAPWVVARQNRLDEKIMATWD
jgi:integrase/recombinase XerD